MASITLKEPQTGLVRGRVVVVNKDGTFNREVLLTGEEYLALGQRGAGAPPGVTVDEWQSGRAVAYGFDLDVGDVKEVQPGIVHMLVESNLVNGRVVDSYLEFAEGEWTGKLPAITVDSVTLAKLPVEKRPIAISNGVLEK